MSFLLKPLFQKNDDKHRSHNKANALGSKIQQRTNDSADRSACNPVCMIQKCNKEIKPSAVNIFGDFCGIIYGKSFIA